MNDADQNSVGAPKDFGSVLRALLGPTQGWSANTKLSEQPRPKPSRAGLFGGHHVRKWLPAKHRRPPARGATPGPARRNACKMLVESSGQLSRMVVQVSRSDQRQYKRLAGV